MKRVVLFAAGVAGLVGCGKPAAGPAPAAAEPTIRAKESIGAGVGPVGASRGREYEGPAKNAPDWAKAKAAPVK